MRDRDPETDRSSLVMTPTLNDRRNGSQTRPLFVAHAPQTFSSGFSDD
jgi:hypothetical protein